MANTSNRGYPKPVTSNFVSDDVLLLMQAYDMIDADIFAILTALNLKAPSVHSHAMSDITGLVTALGDKAPSNHTHDFDQINGVSGTAAAPDGYVLTKTSSGWVPQAPATILGTHSHSIAQVTNLQTALDSKYDAAALAAAAVKGTPVDADTVLSLDNAASNALKRLTWASIKATLKTYFDTLYAPSNIQTIPTGTVMDFAGTSEPSGFLFCYGQAVSRTTYAALFAALGTTYGTGDGSTTFNLPDLRGRVTAGKDDMGGTSANRLTSPINGDNLGAAGGSESHTLTAAQIPAHTHPVNDPGHTHTQDCSVRLPSAGNNFNTPFNGGATAALPVNSATTGITIGNNTGGGGAHNNVQPTLILNKIIKT